MRILSLSLVCIFALLSACNVKPSKQDYGVFIGISSDKINRLDKYNTVVIEPSAFSKDDIKTLHDKRKKVYGYLNVGSLEEYRPYYNRFKDLTLGVYENWEDEKWLDVSAKEWRDFVVDELGKEYSDLGLDGFFIDNTDVFYHNNDDKIFGGLVDILAGLNKYNLDILINGGDEFVSKCIKEKTAKNLFDGINQESVFTAINFDNQTYTKRDKDERDYFLEYLKRAKEAGLSVYLLEYGASGELSREIDTYCKKNGFIWYNASDLYLE